MASNNCRPCWSVAENFRYEPAIVACAQSVKHDIGTPFLASLTIRAPFLPDNKYLLTPWRKDASWYGGLFVDAFVHASAMLRLVLGCDPEQVSAYTPTNASHLPTPDTMVAQAKFGGTIGCAISVTYAGLDFKFELLVTGTNGSVVLRRNSNGSGYFLQVNNGTKQHFDFGGIEAEFLAFAEACKSHEQDRNTPREAMRDLAFVQACLELGKNNGQLRLVQQC